MRIREFEVWKKDSAFKAGPTEPGARGEEIFTGGTPLEAAMKFAAFELGAAWMELQSGEIIFPDGDRCKKCGDGHLTLENRPYTLLPCGCREYAGFRDATCTSDGTYYMGFKSAWGCSEHYA